MLYAILYSAHNYENHIDLPRVIISSFHFIYYLTSEQLTFDNKEEAINFATRNGWKYQVAQVRRSVFFFLLLHGRCVPSASSVLSDELCCASIDFPFLPSSSFSFSGNLYERETRGLQHLQGQLP